MGDDTYLSVFSQPLSGAGDSTMICYPVAFEATNGLCTQSQTLLMRKENITIHDCSYTLLIFCYHSTGNNNIHNYLRKETIATSSKRR